MKHLTHTPQIKDESTQNFEHRFCMKCKKHNRCDECGTCIHCTMFDNIHSLDYFNDHDLQICNRCVDFLELLKDSPVIENDIAIDG